MSLDLESPNKRRILSIDGGGILGTFPAAFLSGLEKQLGCPISHYFDLISGTSTGGIITLGLGRFCRKNCLVTNKLYHSHCSMA